jgi:hypothetical protein
MVILLELRKHRVNVRRGKEAKEAVTFLKKNNQKTFANWAPGGENSKVQISKSFLVLFFKKEALAFFRFAAVPAAR